MKNYLLTILAIVFVGCSGIRVVNTDLGDNVDFAKYKTFNFYRVNATGDTNSHLFNARVELLKDAISHELVSRGFTQSSNNPDMLVNIGIKIKEQIQTRETDWRTDGAPQYIGQRNYTWKSEEIEVGRYREGTVAIHLVDPAQKKLLWKGVVQGIVPDEQSNVQKSVQKGVKLLMEGLPVSVK